MTLKVGREREEGGKGKREGKELRSTLRAVQEEALFLEDGFVS